MAEQKIGGLGRWSEAEARQVLATWETSGKSIGAFARTKGFTPQRLYWWRERLGKKVEERVVPRFVPVVVKAPAVSLESCAAIVVTTPAGARVEVREVNATTAAWVVALLERGEHGGGS